MSAVADETAEDIPVRDITLNLNGIGVVQEPSAAQNARARQVMSKVSREELEDRCLRLHEENILLKRHAHKQEDKIKRMATKLVRLVRDRRRVEVCVGGGRDVEMEEMMEELQEKVLDLEKQNQALKQRLLVAKQQLQTSHPSLYSHVQSRVNTGLRVLATPPQPHTPGGAGSRLGQGEVGARAAQALLPRYGHSLLDDARAEIRNLENVIESQRSEMAEMERSLDECVEQRRQKDLEYEESLQQLREQQASKQRSSIRDGVELIKLQRELAERGHAFTALEGRFLQLQESQQTLKASHDALLVRGEELSEQLKAERQRSLERHSQTSALRYSVTQELQEHIVGLERERDLLKENCDKLLSSAFDVSQEQRWRTRVQQLQVQVSQLEEALRTDLADKNQILDKVKAERDLNENLTQENKELQLRYLEQKQQLDEIKDRMKFFTKESEIDAAELSEALILIKVRKTQKSGELGFLEKMEENINVDLERSLRELQATYAETVQELEKTRNMLIIQHKINKDYQAELEAVSCKLEGVQQEQVLQQEGSSQLLDSRAARIRRLEVQLKDVAYGTTAHAPHPVQSPEHADALDEMVHLSRGENLLEIHLGVALLSPEVLERLGEADPSTFCTFAFYDYELQTTAVVRGTQPDYAFTSRYLLQVDDLLLHYLDAGTVAVEIQHAQGLEFQTLAVGSIRLSPVLEQDGTVFGKMELVGSGVCGDLQGFGTLEFWLRFRVPVQQTFRRHQQRLKAQSYMSSSLGHDQDLAAPASLAEGPTTSLAEDRVNQLHVTVQNCCGLKLHPHQAPPRAYIMYRFYGFPDHDTPIAPCGSAPQFQDEAVFPVSMTAELDCYLRAESLALYVFNDDDEAEHFIGKACVPLSSLADDKAITGSFELLDSATLPAGRVSVTLKWQQSYMPLAGVISTEMPENPSTEDEKEEMKRKSLSSSKVPLAKPRRSLSSITSRKVSFQLATQEQSQERLREEEEEEEDSQASEGQMIPIGQSISDGSEISEDLPAPQEDPQQIEGSDLSESVLSDSDDCIVPAHNSQAKKQPSECIRVEIVALSVCEGSSLAQDAGAARLFVELNLLDLQTAETPLALPKPRRGQRVYYNYSKVFYVDMESHMTRRRLLRDVLEGRNTQLESMKFTVVSDPPEEEEQEKECEDVGVAYLRIPQILEQQTDPSEFTLGIMDMKNGTEVLGHLQVSVEALKSLRSIMEDPDHDHSILA